jgi:CcmD family protein
MNDPASGYLVVAYLVTAAAIGGYIARIGRRRRSLERRLAGLRTPAPEPPGEGPEAG